jgi:hypothetical protein
LTELARIELGNICFLARVTRKYRPQVKMSNQVAPRAETRATNPSSIYYDLLSQKMQADKRRYGAFMATTRSNPSQRHGIRIDPELRAEFYKAQLDAVDAALPPWEWDPAWMHGETSRVQTILNLRDDRAQLHEREKFSPQTLDLKPEDTMSRETALTLTADASHWQNVYARTRNQLITSETRLSVLKLALDRIALGQVGRRENLLASEISESGMPKPDWQLAEQVLEEMKSW